VFTCDGHLSDLGWMTYAVFVRDEDDPETTSCFAWGEDPEGLAAGDYDDERVGVEPTFALAGCVPP
jgi:hypothetical protein